MDECSSELKSMSEFRFHSNSLYSPPARLSAHLVRVVREIDFVENLRGLMLDGLHLHLVRRVLPLAVPQRLLQPLRRVQRDRVPPRPQELIQVLKIF